MTELEDMTNAAEQMDWKQLMFNGGPPCFHIESRKFCGRAKRWPGHEIKPLEAWSGHAFVSLAELLRRLASAPAPLDVEKVARELAEFTEKKFEEAMEEAVYDVRASDFEMILRKHLPSPEGKE